MFELAIESHFDSAHLLRGYDGPCKDLHGHTWKVEVVVQKDKLNDIGLVIDFKDIRSKLNGFIKHIDHVNLNDIPYFKQVNPSTENLAKYIYDGFSKEVQPLKIKHVTVWESDTASVTYFP